MSKVVFVLALLGACYTGLQWYSYAGLDPNSTHSWDQWDHDENMQALWWVSVSCFVIAGAAGLRWAYVHNQKERTREFKEAVRQQFQRDFEEAWAAYVPSDREIAQYHQLYQNQQGIAATSQMLMNTAYAAGGDNALAAFGRINSASIARHHQRKAQALYYTLFYCDRLHQIVNTHGIKSVETVNVAVELAYWVAVAKELGAIPPFATLP